AEAIAENRRSELFELAKIYEERGVEPGLARLVADQLMAHDAVGAHARDELGISETMIARPLQAGLTSAGSFVVGALVPLLAITLAAKSVRIGLTVAITLGALLGLGALGAQLGGAPRGRAALRVAGLSMLSMALTYGIGRIVGANI
ncbi:MAG: vacuolar iron transporter family protein, partial [Actinomycetota bacterium]|nr:vacuolar iron transporter family protein [Actinomycetota bacterium]